MKVFISSKMSGLKNYGYENFFKKEQELRAQGLDVLNPAPQCSYFVLYVDLLYFPPAIDPTINTTITQNHHFL